MSADALTQRQDGSSLDPRSNAEWAEWVSATKTRNYLLDDPLLDWLDLYGEHKGFIRDDKLATYDERTDFSKFVMRKGNEFEDAIVNFLRGHSSVKEVATTPADSKSLAKAEETFQLMCDGAEIIAQGVLRNAEYKVYGMPDLLVRSDVLARLFKGALTTNDARTIAPDLGGAAHHYRVVDIKYTSLRLSSKGELGNSGSSPAYKGQLHLYNQMLGALQGYEAPVAYLLGRSWKQTKKGKTERGDSAMERLGPVSQSATLPGGVAIHDKVDAAVDWIRLTRKQGQRWDVLPEPSRDELRPNLAHTQDVPWHAAKRSIAKDLDDLTMLWRVGVKGRKDAMSAGIYRWTDPKCTPTILGINGATTKPVLDSILHVNRDSTADAVLPAKVRADEDYWRTGGRQEFFVDFETTSDLDDNFDVIPDRDGQSLIFMVGCGHIGDGGEWIFKCFTADRLDESSEKKIIDNWLSHMEEITDSGLGPATKPIIYHWSHAEVSTFSTAYNAARKRHPDNKWQKLNWFDFLKRVVRVEPVVVRGSFGFGLKNMAKALKTLGHVASEWTDGPTDGLGAMVAAWWCETQASQTGTRLLDHELMQEVVKYNEVDCKVMMEIIEHLRRSH